MVNILVTYDVSTQTAAGRKRLRKVAQLCLNYGQRVQKSVFECQISDVDYVKLMQCLKSEMDEKEDSIRIYRLPYQYGKKVTHLGINEPLDFNETLVF